VLAEWANELIRRSEHEACAFSAVRDARITSDHGRCCLEARVCKQYVAGWRQAFKAAAHRGARLERDGKRWRGELVVDV
jgi:hypothetical protein